MGILKERRREGAICPICKSPDYKYEGRVFKTHGKHQFSCNSCGRTWQYGSSDSVYLRLSKEE